MWQNTMEKRQTQLKKNIERYKVKTKRLQKEYFRNFLELNHLTLVEVNVCPDCGMWRIAGIKNFENEELRKRHAIIFQAEQEMYLALRKYLTNKSRSEYEYNLPPDIGYEDLADIITANFAYKVTSEEYDDCSYYA